MGNKLCNYSCSCIKSKSLFFNLCNTESFHNSIEISLLNDRQINNNENDPLFIDSYNAYNNFFFLLNRIILIQRTVKSFLSKCKKPILPLVDAPTGRYYIEVNDEPQVNTEDNGSLKKINMSFYSNSITGQSEYLMPNSIKGYFLKKKKKYQYKGYLQGKVKTGFGKVIWEDGSILYANFTNNKAEGICRYIDSTGVEFIGEYTNNRPFGYGIFNQGDEVSYEGFWHNNMLYGIGCEVFNDKTLFRGNYIECNKQGIGLYRWADGTIYQGQWENNQMSGHGIILYRDDRIYSGEMKNGVMNGFGEFLWPDKKRYIGFYKNDVKEGFGLFIWTIQPLLAFVGFWVNGKQNGIGIKIKDTKLRYGVWKDGKKDFWLNNTWQIKKFFKKSQEQYLAFFEQKETIFIKKIINLINTME